MSTQDDYRIKRELWRDTLTACIPRVPDVTHAEAVADSAVEAYEARFEQSTKRESERSLRQKGIERLREARLERLRTAQAEQREAEARAQAAADQAEREAAEAIEAARRSTILRREGSQEGGDA